MSSPYSILGLEPGSDLRAAKAAFHAVAKTCHPDVNPDPAAHERFEAAQTAYRQITLGAASADAPPRATNPRAGRMTEIDLNVSVWTAARGGAVKGSCPLGKASVRVPAGARTGDRILTRIGKVDVACVVRVEESDGFSTEGSNLVTTLRLSAAQARLGGPAEIETPNGRLRLNVPKGTEEGDTLMVKGKGLPAQGARAAGDLYLQVEVIETMTDRAVTMLDKILLKARRPRSGQAGDETRDQGKGTQEEEAA
jgi:curved DNA-binding protein